MKVLVATRATQGARRSDFSRCVNGELVWMLEACPASRRKVDGKCVCGRSFMGLSSHRYTTTAIVREIPGFSREDYAIALGASFDAQGMCSCCTMRTVTEFVDELIGLAAGWPEGAVIERRLDALDVRVVLGTKPVKPEEGG